MSVLEFRLLGLEQEAGFAEIRTCLLGVLNSGFKGLGFCSLRVEYLGNLEVVPTKLSYTPLFSFEDYALGFWALG